MASRSERALRPLRHVLLTWRFVEDWFQEELQGSPWMCVNPQCPVSNLGTDKEPVEAAGGHFLCPECSEFICYRCGAFFLPVGDVVPPDICKTRCKFFSCCIRYRLHDACHREVAGWSRRSYIDIEADHLGDALDEEAAGTPDGVSLPGAMPLTDG